MVEVRYKKRRAGAAPFQLRRNSKRSESEAESGIIGNIGLYGNNPSLRQALIQMQADMNAIYNDGKRNAKKRHTGQHSGGRHPYSKFNDNSKNSVK